MKKKNIFLIIFLLVIVLLKINSVSAKEIVDNKNNSIISAISSIQILDSDAVDEPLKDKIDKTTCGTGSGKITIAKKIPELTSFIVTVVQIAVPVILVIMGSLDLFKGITANKEDEMKKGQQMFVKRLAIAAVIFFVVIIVKFFISIVADTNVSNMVKCIDCFVSNDCEEV